jgi:DNA polymerase-3 subunit chi
MIATISFYQIQGDIYTATFPRIITKILKEEERVDLLCADKEEMRKLDTLLWTFAQLSFLPHATEDDEYQEIQDLLLITKLPSSHLDKRTLVLTSCESLPEHSLDGYAKLFIITDKPINKEVLLDSLSVKNQKVEIKHFAQKQDGSWDNLLPMA